jgi:hypothetical protein
MCTRSGTGVIFTFQELWLEIEENKGVRLFPPKPTTPRQKPFPGTSDCRLEKWGSS